MAKLSSKSRNKLPKSSFGMPGERKYPMPDKSHARNAKARASQQLHKGNISASTKAHIDAMADRKLGKKGKSMAHKEHQMNLETDYNEFSGGRKGYKHDTSSHIPGTANMPAQHHDKAHPAGPSHPSIHSFHRIGHKDHSSKMSEG